MRHLIKLIEQIIECDRATEIMTLVKMKETAELALIEAKRLDDEYDPTPYCTGCGATTRANCKRGPRAEND